MAFIGHASFRPYGKAEQKTSKRFALTRMITKISRVTVKISRVNVRTSRITLHRIQFASLVFSYTSIQLSVNTLNWIASTHLLCVII